MIRKNLEEKIEWLVSVQHFYAATHAISQFFTQNELVYVKTVSDISIILYSRDSHVLQE